MFVGKEEGTTKASICITRVITILVFYSHLPHVLAEEIVDSISISEVWYCSY